MKKNDLLTQLSEQTGHALTAQGATLTCAESCTGGWLAKAITDVAGSSGWFAYGFVTYSNQAKQQLLGVTPGALARYGAVSEAVARQMAQGALKVAHARYAIAISGIAGPGGGSQAKPVGTVCFAFACANGALSSDCQLFTGGREAVRYQAACYALRVFCQKISQNS